MRLAGSVPRSVAHGANETWKGLKGKLSGSVYWQAYADERSAFRQLYRGASAKELNGPFHFHHNARCRAIVEEALAYRDGEHYTTLAYSIMPNHVHWVARHISPKYHMGQLIGQLKRFVARQCNLVLGRTGEQFWEHEGWDKAIRTQEELMHTLSYVLYNPVAAGLAPNWQKWPGNYVYPPLRSAF